MNGVEKSATRTWAIALLLVALALVLVGATFASGSPLAGFGLVRFWPVLLGRAAAIPIHVLTLIRFGLFVAAMSI